MRLNWTTTWIALGMTIASATQAATLYERDGITLEGTVRLVNRGAGICQVLEDRHSPDVYERMKPNQGQPLHVWRLDFAARNGSGRWLEHLTANLSIASEWPPCTTWSGPEGNYPGGVQWASSFEFLQKPYGMEPGSEVSDTVFVLSFDGQQPRFERWTVDYRFAARNDGVAGGAPAPTAPAASRQPATQATAEQENIFWQSIMNSKNTAEFEAYLAQFPNGVFQRLAETRLAELRVAAGDTSEPRSGTEPGSAAAADPGVGTQSPGQEFRPGAEPICTGETNAAPCWKELASHPQCYVWDDFYPTLLFYMEFLGREVPMLRDHTHHHLFEQSVTWSGECSGGVASGTGTLKWVRKKIPEDRLHTARYFRYEADEHESTGLLRDGRASGRWVLYQRVGDDDGSFSFEQVEEGPFAEGKRHGHWTSQVSNADGSGYVDQGPFVHGRKHGNWISRTTTGESHAQTFVNGEPQ